MRSGGRFIRGVKKKAWNLSLVNSSSMVFILFYLLYIFLNPCQTTTNWNSSLPNSILDWNSSLAKQTKLSHPKVNVIALSRLLKLLHVDLMGPTRVESLGGKRYIMVVVDDFSRYSWVEFLREKSKACEKMEKLCKRLQNEKGVPIIKIRSDHGKEFENAKFEPFCNEHGIRKEFSTPKTSQQNGVVERKNRIIQEMARVKLLNKDIPQKFWGEAVNTLCHIGNRIFFREGTKKTLYEIWHEKKPKVKYFLVFGSKCFILNDRENLRNCDAKSNEGIFLGYSMNSRAYRVYNKQTKTVMESIMWS